MKLSIIIPYYNVKEYTDELLDVLDPQVKDRKDVEVVVVDDGSNIPYKTDYKWCKVIHKKNGGCATARNMGLNNTTGEYVQFIDADDLVPDYFVERILKEIELKHPDVFDYSWKSLSNQGSQHDIKLKSDNDRLHNPSVCTRCFSRAYIGDVRFNEKKDCTEDEDFSRKMGYLKSDGFKHASVTDYMYYYRTYVENSKFKRFKKGLQKTKRIVYYYDHVTADMTELFEEIKKEDEIHEIWLVTKQCDIPDMNRYARVSNETRLWGHELRGQSWKGFIHIVPPEKADIIIYASKIKKVFGTTTFIYNYCAQMGRYHSIIVLYDEIDPDVLKRFEKVTKLIRNDSKKEIYCDSLIMNSLMDEIPKNVIYKKSIQMVHACKQGLLRIPRDRDYIVNVSQFSKDTWGNAAKDGIVIHNPSYKDQKKALVLISATRIGSSDKGDNDKRMKVLATSLNSKEIPYVWLNYSDKPLPGMPANFINMPATLDIQRFIKKADYLVQLSSIEAYPYSVLEALINNTAVIVTEFESGKELGVKDGVNGYVIPFDMNFDVDKLLNVPKFNFVYDNNKIFNQWNKLLRMPPVERKEELPQDDLIKVKVVKAFYDKYTKKRIEVGSTILPRDRVIEIQEVEKGKKLKLIEVVEDE